MIKVQKDYSKVPEVLNTERAEKARNQALLRSNKHPKFSTLFKSSTVKDILVKIYHSKCGYCESPIPPQISIPEIDHYRPKTGLKNDPAHPGYYWLTYEWSNLILCCNRCNAAKGIHFPVQGKQVENPQDIQSEWRADSQSFLLEKPLLLNPELDFPEEHLIFLPDGTVKEKEKSERGKATIKICHLNRDALVFARKKVIQRFTRSLQQQFVRLFESQKKGTIKTKEGFQSLLETSLFPIFIDLMECGNPEREYSQLGRQMVQDFDRFFLEPLPSEEVRQVLALAFALFQKEQSEKKDREIISLDSNATLTFKINRLNLQNFRGFKGKEFIFPDSNFTLFIGDNGEGKSAILDALSLSVSSTFIGFGIGDSKQIQDEEVHQASQSYDDSIRMEKNYPVLIQTEATVMDKRIQWELKRFEKKEITVTEDLFLTDITSLFSSPVQNGEPVTLPVFSYYGTGRLWLQKKEQEIEPSSPPSRWDGYQDCLSPLSNEKKLMGWFKEQELIQIQQKTEIKLYKAVKNAIIECVEEFREVRFDFREDTMMLELDKDLQIPAYLLSDGYRNMLVMVADIAYKMGILNPHLGEDLISQTPGVVLVDELDLHLHPKWQRSVIGDLRRTFPKVQFIATTHSPFLIQSLKPGELINLSKESLGEYVDASIEDITEDEMGIDIPQKSKRYREMFKVSEQYYQMLQEGKQSKEDQEKLQKLKHQLDELLIPFSGDPAFMAFLKSERVAAGLK